MFGGIREDFELLYGRCELHAGFRCLLTSGCEDDDLSFGYRRKTWKRHNTKLESSEQRELSGRSWSVFLSRGFFRLRKFGFSPRSDRLAGSFIMRILLVLFRRRLRRRLMILML